MSPTKKLFALSILPALFLISCALSTISSSDNVAEQNKQISRDIASQKNRLLTYSQLQAMPAKKVYDYYMKLYAMMSEIERFQFNNKNGLDVPKKSSRLFQMIEESVAAGTETFPPYAEGKDCLIGGYWGQWTRKAKTDANGNTVYRLTCDSPNRCTIPGSPTPNTGHACNPKFFLYNDSVSPATPYCADLKADLTTSNCRVVVEQSYRDKGQAGFADQFKRSALRAIEQDAKYQGISREAAALAFQQDVYSEYQRIQDYCGTTEAEWKRHNAGQDKSCFPLMAQYQEIQNLMAEVVQTPIPPENIPGAPIAETPIPVPTPAPREPAVGGSDGLGPYSCIKAGLNQAGYPGVSNKFIALFAVNAKYRADYYGGSTLLRKNKTIRNTIKALTSIGLCKAKYYEFGGAEAGNSSAWLSQDKFNRNSFAPSEYQSLFGVPWASAMPNDMAWESATPSMHKRVWQKASPSDAHMCLSKSNYKIEDKACRILFKTCKLDPAPCGEEPRGGSSNGGDNKGNNNGNDNGPSNNGPSNNGPSNNGPSNNGPSNNAGNDNGPDTSGGEVGEGSNAESGHGSNNGAGMGSGPQ